MKFCVFFSHVTLVVCILYVGLWDVKERIYDIVYSCFFYQDQLMMLEERGMNAKRNRHASINMEHKIHKIKKYM